MMNRIAQFTALVGALSLLIGGVALTPSVSDAAGWISPDNLTASWVQDIEREINKKEYRYVFANDPRSPQASVVKLLNRAAQVLEADNPALAKDLVDEALRVLEEGVRRQYFSQNDVAPILSFIREHVPMEARRT